MPNDAVRDDWEVHITYDTRRLWTCLNTKPTREDALQLVARCRADEPHLRFKLVHVVTTVDEESA